MLITYISTEPGSPAFPYYNVGNVLRIFGLGGKQGPDSSLSDNIRNVVGNKPAISLKAVLEHVLQAMGSGSFDQPEKSEEPNWYASAVFGGSMATFGGLLVYAGRAFCVRFLKRIPQGNHVTPDMFAEKRWIRGVVTSWVT